MNLTIVIILAVVFLLASIVCFNFHLELLGSAAGLLFILSLLTIFIAPYAGKETVCSSETKEFVIENMRYDDDGYLTYLIDDKGEAHKLYEFDGFDTIRTVSIAENDEISYIETTEKIVIKFLFVRTHIERITYEAKLSKDAYYDYKYGKNSNIVPIE